VLGRPHKEEKIIGKIKAANGLQMPDNNELLPLTILGFMKQGNSPPISPSSSNPSQEAHELHAEEIRRSLRKFARRSYIAYDSVGGFLDNTTWSKTLRLYPSARDTYLIINNWKWFAEVLLQGFNCKMGLDDNRYYLDIRWHGVGAFGDFSRSCRRLAEQCNASHARGDKYECQQDNSKAIIKANILNKIRGCANKHQTITTFEVDRLEIDMLNELRTSGALHCLYPDIIKISPSKDRKDRLDLDKTSYDRIYGHISGTRKDVLIFDIHWARDGKLGGKHENRQCCIIS
jgi:hypothetical protein